MSLHTTNTTKTIWSTIGSFARCTHHWSTGPKKAPTHSVDMCNSGRGMMLARGCIQSLQCNTNACPTGVATQDKGLYRGLVVQDKKLRIVNFHASTLESFLSLMAAMGIQNPSYLDPARIMRRINQGVVKNYAQIYTQLEPGALLKKGKDITCDFKDDWLRARADDFNGQA